VELRCAASREWFSRYPFNRHLVGQAQSCTLRAGTGPSVASSASNCSAKLATERFDFLFCFG